MSKTVVNKISSESVQKATKRGWSEWIEILDAVGGRNLSHQEIVKLLAKKYRLGPWWQQMVTNGYEVHIGRRIEGQNQKGQYSVTVTKSFRVSHKVLWRWLKSNSGIKVWLDPMGPFSLRVGQQFEVRGGIFGEVRTIKPLSRIRLRWQDSEWLKPTTVQISIWEKKDGSMLGISHDGLRDAAAKAQMRAHWRSTIDSLKVT